MTTEREYREWHRQKKKQIKRKRTRNSWLWFLIVFLAVAFTVKNNPDWFSIPWQNNSLRSLTQEFVIEINEPIAPFTGNNLQNLDYERIDRQAKNLQYTGYDTTELAELLSTFATTDSEKARIIYTWITTHIDYDVPALANLFQNNIYPDVTTKSVLTKRRTICTGYANLYQQLAEKMGLKSVIVLGYAKSGDYIVGENKRVNHAWNAVKIDENWHLMEPTWGAGTVRDNVFIPQFNPFYFATLPQQFIYTHFPEDSKWQLLDFSYTRSQFDSLPDVASDLFVNNIQLISHRREDIATDGELTLTLQAPENIVAIAKLKSQDDSIAGNYTLVQRQGKNILINARFPEQGDYQLDIFAKPKDGNNSYPLVVSYDVSASHSSQQFPKTFTTFYEHNGYLETPLQAKLMNNQSTYFKLKIDSATDVQVVNKSTNKWQKLIRYGNVFSGNINVQGNVTVLAKFPNDSRYWALLEYN